LTPEIAAAGAVGGAGRLLLREKNTHSLSECQEKRVQSPLFYCPKINI
jgi:hypothetical protein